MFGKIPFWAHFSAGALASLFILLMSATGLILTYEAQITDRAVRSAIVAPGAAAPLDATALVTAAEALGAKPGQTLVIAARAGDPAELRSGRTGTLLDPYDGTALTEAGAGTAAFFRQVTNLHRWLSLSGPSDTGGAINDAANLGFLLLVLSGLYLWLPPALRWSLLRMRLVFRRGLPTAQARHLNWHQVLGAWALLPLLVIVLSGVVMSYPWANALVFRAVGEAVPVRSGPPSGASALPGDLAAARLGGAQPLDPETLIAAAGAVVPGWTTAAIALPEPDAAYVALTMDRGNGRQAALRATLILDRVSGVVVAQSGAGAQSTGAQIRGWLRFAHTGEVYGVIGQTVAGLACVAAMVLVYTGFSLGLRRIGRMRRRARLTA